MNLQAYFCILYVYMYSAMMRILDYKTITGCIMIAAIGGSTVGN